ncbi:MAG: NADH-quinone oxidoreductase subunit NuoE [Rickettsiales bacterium]|nr:NADH-quinone oxidoreductase subunit NuoE [Rickettsiales bacterium]
MSTVSIKKFEQPKSFSFTPENLAEAEKHIAKYPAGREQSAVMPLLMLAQRQHDNWLPVAAIEVVAKMVNMPYIRAYEVASFYTMYNLAPVGRYHIQCCTTTPCWLRGSDEVIKACKDTLGIEPGQTSEDGRFTLTEVECLGACVNAPMLQVTSSIDDDYFEDLNYDTTREILQKLKHGEKPRPGPQSGRISSEPQGGKTTLKEPANARG